MLEMMFLLIDNRQSMCPKEEEIMNIREWRQKEGQKEIEIKIQKRRGRKWDKRSRISKKVGMPREIKEIQRQSILESPLG